MANTKLKFLLSGTVDSGELVIYAGDINQPASAVLLPSNSLAQNQELLDGLFGGGKTTLAGDWSAGLTIEFKGTYANSNIPPLAFDGSTLALTPSAFYNSNGQQSYVAATASVTLTDNSNPPNGGTLVIDGVSFSYGGNFPGSFYWEPDYSDSASPYNLVASVSGVLQPGPAAPVVDISGLLMDDPDNPGNQIAYDGSLSVTGGANGVSQIDTLEVVASGGTFDINTSTGATSGIPYGISASDLQTMLIATNTSLFGACAVSLVSSADNDWLYWIELDQSSTTGSADPTNLTGSVNVTESILQAGGGSLFVNSGTNGGMS